SGWHPELLLGSELRGRTLGLFGAGRIGQAVGRRAVPFGMRIVYTARHPRPEFEREVGAARVELPRLLREGDVLSLPVPAAPETRKEMARIAVANVQAVLSGRPPLTPVFG